MAPAFRTRFGPTVKVLPVAIRSLLHGEEPPGATHCNAREPARHREALLGCYTEPGTLLPLDDKPPPQTGLAGTVKVTHIVPPGLEDKLKAAYPTTAITENRRATGRSPAKNNHRHAPQCPTNGKGASLILEPGNFPKWEVDAATDTMQRGELFQVMHPKQCTCPIAESCNATWGEPEFPATQEVSTETSFESPFSEAEEMELVAELLSVASERNWICSSESCLRRVEGVSRKVGKFVGKIAKPLGGVLKGWPRPRCPSWAALWVRLYPFRE